MERKVLTHEELMTMLEQAGSNGGSSLNMRSEALQSKKKKRYIPRIKRELRKVSRLLLPIDLAIPFNPVTGQSEPDGFNAGNCYRPPISATSSALVLKEMAQTNEALRTTLMKRAGVTEWDTSDAKTLTKQDWVIFKKYRVPRIFTIPAIHVNIPALSNSQFGVDYLSNVERDSDGGVVGDYPMILKINKLFRDIAYEELNDYNKALDRGEFEHDDQQKKKYISGIYGKVLVSDDSPRNFVTLIEVPLASDSSISSEFQFSEFTEATDVKKLLVLSNYTQKLRECVEKFMSGSLATLDTHFDYLEMDMSCPTSGDTQTTAGKAEFGKAVSYAQPVISFATLAASNPALKDEIDRFNVLVGEYLDSETDIENLVRISSSIRPLNDETVSKILKALPTVLKLDNRFLTQEVMKQNQDVITLAFGDDGLALLEELDAGVSDKDTGSLNATDAEAKAKSYSLENLETFADDIVSDISEDDDVYGAAESVVDSISK